MCSSRHIVGATASENLSGNRVARLFGVISPTTRTTAVTATVAIHGPHCDPRRSTNSTVATEAARMFTKLLATRSVLSIASGSSRSDLRRRVRRSSSPSCSTRSRGTDTRAVSDPENNPDARMQAARMMT